MRSVHTINLICRVERLSESNYDMTQQRDEGRRRINSIRCRHTCLMYIHITHGCDATFLCGFPLRAASRRPFTNTRSVDPALIACKPECVLDFRVYTYVGMNIYCPSGDSTEFCCDVETGIYQFFTPLTRI